MEGRREAGDLGRHVEPPTSEGGDTPAGERQAPGPEPSSRYLYAGCRMASRQVPAMLVLG